MNNFISLLKLELDDSFNKSEKKNYTLKSLIILGLIIIIFFSLFVNFMLYESFRLVTNALYVYPLILSVGILILTFFTSIYRVKSSIFSLKDRVNLTPLPLKKSLIVSVKLTLAYLEELVLSLLIFLPCIIFYSQTDLSFIFFGFLLLITIPMISLLLAFLIGFLLQMLTVRFNFLKYIGTFLYIILILGSCFISFFFNNNTLDNEQISTLTIIKDIFPFNVLYNGFILHNLAYFFGYLMISVLALVVVIFLYQLFYDKFFNLLEYVGKKKAFFTKDIKTTKLLPSLIKQDLKRLVNEQMFFISAILPVILAGVMSICFSFMFEGSFQDLEAEEAKVASYIIRNIVLPYIVFFFLGLASYTAYAITLEGKNFWIVRTLPIKDGTYLKAKLIEHYLLEGPLMLIFSIIMVVICKYSLALSLFVIILPQIFIVLIGVIGLLVNLKWPKMVWSNYKQIKNAASNVAMSLIGMAISIVLVLCGILISLFTNEIVGIIVVSCLIIMLLIGAIYLLKVNGSKLLNKIEV